jgi:hypothetical protein
MYVIFDAIDSVGTRRTRRKPNEYGPRERRSDGVRMPTKGGGYSETFQ